MSDVIHGGMVCQESGRLQVDQARPFPRGRRPHRVGCLTMGDDLLIRRLGDDRAVAHDVVQHAVVAVAGPTLGQRHRHDDVAVVHKTVMCHVGERLDERPIADAGRAKRVNATRPSSRQRSSRAGKRQPCKKWLLVHRAVVVYRVGGIVDADPTVAQMHGILVDELPEDTSGQALGCIRERFRARRCGGLYFARLLVGMQVQISLKCTRGGNSMTVTSKHYLQVTEDHYAAGSALQNPVQQSAAPARNTPQQKTVETHKCSRCRQLREPAIPPPDPS